MPTYRIVEVNKTTYKYYKIQRLYKILWWEFWITQFHNEMFPDGKMYSRKCAEKNMSLL